MTKYIKTYLDSITGTEKTEVETALKNAVGLYAGGTADVHMAVTPAGSGLTKFGFRATTLGTPYGARFLGYINQGVDVGAVIETISAGVATERVRINGSGVGIGTDTPAAQLHVRPAANVNLEVGTVSAALRFEILNDARSAYVPLRIQASDISLNPAGGSVAIGGALAAHKLAVYGGSSGGIIAFATGGSTAFEMYNTSVNKTWAIYPLTNGSDTDFALYSNSGSPGTRLVLQGATGNLGLGTTSPAAKLDINTGAAAGTISDAVVLQGGAAGTLGSGARLTLSGGGGLSRGVSITGVNSTGGGNGHDMIFSTSGSTSSPSEKMRITYSGNVGIGATVPTNKLYVAGDIRCNGEIFGSSEAGYIVIAPNSPTASSAYISRGSGSAYNPGGLELFAGGFERIRVLTGGFVGIGTAAPGRPLEVSDATVGGTIRFRHSSTFSEIAHLNDVLYITNAAATGVTSFWNGGTERLQLNQTGVLRPGADNTQSLGHASFRWSTVYAGTGAINTSDATMKALRDGTPIGMNYKVSSLTDDEIAAAKDIIKEIGVFKWQDSVADKGEDARLHIGLTVQRVVQIMEGHGLDPWAYGFMCRDAITRRVKEIKTVKEQKTEPDPTFDIVIEMIDGVPTQVERERPPRPVFESIPLIGLDGQPVVERKQKTEMAEVIEERIDTSSGSPVLVTDIQIKEMPVFEEIPVLDEGGNPVMTTIVENDEDNEDAEPVEKEIPRTYPMPVMIDVPVMHQVPVMIDVEKEVETDEPAGERLGFRPDQLALFILAGLR